MANEGSSEDQSVLVWSMMSWARRESSGEREPLKARAQIRSGVGVEWLGDPLRSGLSSASGALEVPAWSGSKEGVGEGETTMAFTGL